MVIERMICLSNGSSTLPIELRQGDYNVEIRLLVYETPQQLMDMTGNVATVTYEKDGVATDPYDAIVEEGNYLRFSFPTTVANENGKGLIQVAIYAADALLHSYMLPFVVERSLPLPAHGAASDPAPAFFSLVKETRAEVADKMDEVTNKTDETLDATQNAVNEKLEEMDATQEQLTESVENAIAETANVPQIGDDYIWLVWDTNKKQYSSTGKRAMPLLKFSVKTGTPGTPVEIKQLGTSENPEIELTIPAGRDGSINDFSFYDEKPKPLGEATGGNTGTIARGDHVHPMPRPVDLGAVDENNLIQAQVLLEANSWVNNMQTVAVPKLSENDVVIVAPAYESQYAYNLAGAGASGQGNGTLTFTVTKTPTVDLKANIFMIVKGSEGNDL